MTLNERINLRFEQDDGAVWVFDGDSQNGTELSHLMMMHSDEYSKEELSVICHHAACEIDKLRSELDKAKAQAVPEGYVVVPREPTQKMINESQGLCQPQDVYKAMLRLSEFKAQDKVVIEGDKRVWNIDTINSNGFHATTINKPTRCLIHVFSDQEVRHATNEEILEASESGAEG
ncbi:DUF551 domain-containing protein [Acinetobacter baumannii]